MKYSKREEHVKVNPMFVFLFLCELEDKTEEEYDKFFTMIIKQDSRELLTETMKQVLSFELVSKTVKYLDELEEYLESELN